MPMFLRVCIGFLILFSLNNLSYAASLSDSNLVVRSYTIFHPNRIGLELSIGKSTDEFTFTRKHKTIRKERSAFVNMGYYFQPTLHQKYWLTGSYNYRRIKKSGFFRDFTPIIGVARTFVSHTNYVVDKNNEVSIKKRAGNNYVIGGYSWGMGWQFKPKNAFHIKSVETNLTTLAYYPNFRMVSINPFFKLGLSFSIPK
jgi:hypothetical protein